VIRKLAISLLILCLALSPAYGQDEATEIPGSDSNLAGVLSAVGNVPGRVGIGSGRESIDTFSGILQLQYTDVIIPGDGGFDLPVIRTYSSPQYFNDDSTNRVFGSRWDIHFGRIKSNTPDDEAASYCADANYLNLYDDDRHNPVFQSADGSSHKIFVANSDDVGASDGTTKARHRVTCNEDGTVIIEARNGMRYFFGKQKYLKQGSGLQFLPRLVESDQLVEYNEYLYVTRIADTYGNYHDINYSLQFNSDGEYNISVFTIDSVEASSGLKAEFIYKPSSGSPVQSDPLYVRDSPNLILHSLSAGGVTVEYDFEEVVPDTVSVNNNLVKVSVSAGSTTGSDDLNWEYEYYPANDFTADSFLLSPNSGMLKTVTNRFGGKTTYDYQFIKSATAEPGADIKAMKTKTAEGLGVWSYSFDEGIEGEGYNRTTITAPEGIILRYKHCNMSFIATECDSIPGYLVEQSTTDFGIGGGAGAKQLTRYTWQTSASISPQLERFARYGGILVEKAITVHANLMVQTTVNRDDVYLSMLYANFDNFDNPQLIAERSSDEYLPYPEIDSRLNLDDPNIRARTIIYENKTEADLWLLGLPIETRLFDLTSIASVPASPDNDQITRSSYNNNGSVVTQSNFGAQSQYFYDRKGNVELIIDPNGNRMKSEDFVLGIPQTVTRSLSLGGAEQPYLTRVVDRFTGRVDSESRVRDIQSGESYTTDIVYDDIGRVERIISARSEDADTQITYRTLQTVSTRGTRTDIAQYDSFGRTRRTVVQGGGLNYTVDYRYDAFGRTTYSTLPYENGETAYGTTYRYDSLSRVLSETDSVDTLKVVYAYDGLTTKVTDRKNQTSNYEYRSFSGFDDAQLMQITQPIERSSEFVTTITRTKSGLPLAVTQDDVTRTYEYDGRFRLIRQGRPETQDVVFTYDDNNNLTSRRVLGTGVATYTYDGRNNLLSTEYPVSGLLNTDFPANNTRYSYYDDDKLRTSAKGDTQWAYTYDGNGNISSENMSIQGYDRFDFEYLYDDLDFRRSIIYPSGREVALSPDVLGRPTQVGDYLSSVQYTATDSIESAIYGNGLEWTMSRNEHKLVEEIDYSNRFSNRYIYDDNFNVSEHRNGPSSGDLTRTYEYDGMDRLSMVDIGFIGQRNFRYDFTNNLIDHPLPEVGDRNVSMSYESRSSGSLLEDIQSSSDFSSNFETDVFHDAHGNVGSYRGFNLAFDDSGVLRSIQKGDSVSATYHYDAHGMRTIIQKDGLETVTLYSGGQLLHESNLQLGLTSEYMYLGKYLIAREDMQDSAVDSDGDGIPNVLEGVSIDSDRDGILDILDSDSDGDGVPDALEGSGDTDGDGVPDFQDTDKNNDGILDIDDNIPAQQHCSEFLNYDSDLGMVTVSITENGITRQVPYTQVEQYQPDADLDGDRVANRKDFDMDGDQNRYAVDGFASNEWERNDRFLADIDCDGIPNWYDLDSDGDNISDVDEMPVISFAEKDSDGDGVPNVYENISADNGAIDFTQLFTRLPYFHATLDDDSNFVIQGASRYTLNNSGANFVLSADNIAAIQSSAQPSIKYAFESLTLESRLPPEAMDYANCNAGNGLGLVTLDFSGAGVAGSGTEIVAGNSVGYTEQQLEQAVDYLSRTFTNQIRCESTSGISNSTGRQSRPVYATKIQTLNFESLPAELTGSWIIEVVDPGNLSFDREGTVSR